MYKLLLRAVPILLLGWEVRAVEPWHYANRSHRREVVLSSFSQGRTNIPLFVRIEPAPDLYVDPASVIVDETTVPLCPTGSTASAWAQPSGDIAETSFTAAGVTPANAERRFLVYYALTSAPAAYTWRSDSASQWGAYQELDRNANGRADALRLQSDTLALERSWSESSGRLRTDRQPGYSLLEKLANGWKPVEGFAPTYVPVTGTNLYPQMKPETSAPPATAVARDPAQMAVSFRFAPLPRPSNHAAEATYRLLRGKPWCEFVLTVHPEAGDLELARDAWSWRVLYFNTNACRFDRMVSDTNGDQPVAATWNTQMHWLILYSSTSGRAFGWFLFRPGLLETQPAGDLAYNGYGYGAEEGSTYRYLWAVTDNKSELVSLFSSMAPGWTTGPAEEQQLIILQPSPPTPEYPCNVYLPEDGLPVELTTPGGADGLAVHWLRSDGSSIPVTLSDLEAGRRWVDQFPYVVTAADPTGTWHLIVRNGSVTKTQSVQVARATHPRLLFSTGDLADLRSRRFTTHATDWSNLIAQCDYLMAHPEYPATNIVSSDDLRLYHEWLLALAFVQKIDPSLRYEARMREFFFTMLRYSAWDELPIWGHNDLVATHFLLALALTYDWHYDALTPAERREVRERLSSYTHRAFREIMWFADYSNPQTADTATYECNHLWIDYAGAAAVTYALNGEIDETARQNWNDRIERGFSNVLRFMPSDGTSLEGASYHAYGLFHLERWIELRRRALGQTGAAPYDSHPWFTNTSLYCLYSIAPGGEDNYGGVARFGDTRSSHYQTPLNFEPLLAARLRDPVAQWLATATDYPIRGSFDRLVWRYLWYDPTVPVGSPAGLPTWHHFDDQGIFVWRSSWSNDATQFSIRSGKHVTGSAHPDDGSFTLDRAGVPYLVDMGYSYLKETDEHNVLLVNGTGQFGSGALWPPSSPSNRWGRITHVLGADSTEKTPGSFVDVLCNPQPTYTNSLLTSWTRECLGLGDLLLIRDVVQAGQAVDFDLLLHSYVTDETVPAYSMDQYHTENPWSSLGARKWSVNARAGAPLLIVQDLSSSPWTSINEPSLFVSEYRPSDQGGGYNEDFQEYQYGWQLRRTLRASSGTSLVAAGFEDQIGAWALATWPYGGAEGARATCDGALAVAVLWPQGGWCAGSGGWDITGTMAGRRYAQPGEETRASYFARDVSFMRNDGLSLLAASAPVSLCAYLEHAPTFARPNTASIQTKSPATVTLYCPHRPGWVLLNGALADFSFASNQLTVALPAAGSFELETSPDEDSDGLPDFWEEAILSGYHPMSLGGIQDITPAGDLDGDGLCNREEFVAGTDANNAQSYFSLDANVSAGSVVVSFRAQEATGAGYDGYSRYYGVEQKENMAAPTWLLASRYEAILGRNQVVSITNTFSPPASLYRAGTWLSR